ncbi:hypothetical protein S40288_09288 [Stachybotrys chartarum IBT 40288]|nr:hypothetical protein S40288_09288 [Stachybotrys chartarum IBT 40288]
MGIVEGDVVIMETYRYREARNHNGDPHPQTLQQVRRKTSLLCHPKRKAFHILPCMGFFRHRHRQELGLVFKPPPSSLKNGDPVTLLQLCKMHKLVPLSHRIHIAWVLATAVEHIHRVVWVHKSIRRNNLAFIPKQKPLEWEGERRDDQPLGVDDDPKDPVVGDFDLSNPMLFGFECSRAEGSNTYLEETHSIINNMYRHPDRWGRPTARFLNSHDVYSMGVVLFEIAVWKDVYAVAKPPDHIIAEEVTKTLVDKCRKNASPSGRRGVRTVYTNVLGLCCANQRDERLRCPRLLSAKCYDPTRGRQ